MPPAHKFYFFCVPPRGVEDTAYEHLSIALAEGLRDLGVPIFANVDTWRELPDGPYLLRHDPSVSPGDCTAVIFTEDWFYAKNTIPEALLNGTSRPTLILLDRQDGAQTLSLRPEFRQFNYVMRAHYQRNAVYPSNFRPWAFGLTNRIIEATAGSLPFPEREHRFNVSYRHTRLPHSVRLYVEKSLYPRIERQLPMYHFNDVSNGSLDDAYVRLMKLQTSGRHSPAYYRALGDSAACSAFGGYFVAPFAQRPGGAAARLLRRVLQTFSIRTTQLMQWDSWRLWESLAAGCVTVHVDLQRYGCVLPEMPQAWTHYAGFDLADPDTSIARLLDAIGAGSSMSEAGRTWALQHYSPKAVASRLLKMLAVDTAKDTSLVS